jgi:type VI protein secretion system component VasK
MNVVMCYTEGDGCTYSADHNYPFEYESACDALIDFERLFNEARATVNAFTFAGMEFYADTFVERGEVYLPEFYSLDEWFAAKRIN